MYLSLLDTIGWIVRVVITIVLLTSIDPLLMLLAVFAVPTVLSSAWRPGVERQVEERFAQHNRLAEHLFATATSAAAGERGAGHRHRRRPGRPASYGVATLVRARGAGPLGHGHLALGGLGNLRLGLRRRCRLRCRRARRHGRLGVADLGGRCSAVGVRRRHDRRDRLPARHLARRIEAAGVAGELRRGIDRRHRHRGARATGRRHHASSTCRLPTPGASRLALEDITLHLPAGAVVAVVGENGAGKSTLVKLLAKMYEPTSGDDPDRRPAAAPDAGDRVAQPAHRRVPGLLPVRVQRPAQRRPRDLPQARQ